MCTLHPIKTNLESRSGFMSAIALPSLLRDRKIEPKILQRAKKEGQAAYLGSENAAAVFGLWVLLIQLRGRTRSVLCDIQPWWRWETALFPVMMHIVMLIRNFCPGYWQATIECII